MCVSRKGIGRLQRRRVGDTSRKQPDDSHDRTRLAHVQRLPERVQGDFQRVEVLDCAKLAEEFLGDFHSVVHTIHLPPLLPARASLL